MSKYMILGKRRDDLGFVLDFHNQRAIIRANTKWVEGSPLEVIPPGFNGCFKAMILIHRDWNNIYFLIERNGWTDDDYFNFALKRMEELKITEP